VCVWEVGAAIKADHVLSATIRVHFFSQGSSRVLYTSLDFMLEPVDVIGTFDLVPPTRDFVEDVKADTAKRYSTIQDVFQLTTYSFCVLNEGATESVVQMQLSPNGINWGEDPIADDHIAPGQMKILVYNRFARYVRLKYWTDSGTTNLRIYFQGQG